MTSHNNLNDLVGYTVRVQLSGDEYVYGKLLDLKWDHLIVLGENEEIDYFSLRHLVEIKKNSKEIAMDMPTYNYLNRDTFSNLLQDLENTWVCIKHTEGGFIEGVVSEANMNYLIFIDEEEIKYVPIEKIVKIQLRPLENEEEEIQEEIEEENEENEENENETAQESNNEAIPYTVEENQSEVNSNSKDTESKPIESSEEVKKTEAENSEKKAVEQVEDKTISNHLIEQEEKNRDKPVQEKTTDKHQNNETNKEKEQIPKSPKTKVKVSEIKPMKKTNSPIKRKEVPNPEKRYKKNNITEDFYLRNWKKVKSKKKKK
ncbi:hypothetical protein [Salirhabdus sp. Marseille-P4669]|uniref:hypothetical protein n=1 Tax=Salirhabdus sp. Marseille-P4669 TaxID=2042310 RepID=UPI000C7DF6B7|nr:hypothetical protein [Salirhabdus sp. Marseille-P4669]